MKIRKLPPQKYLKECFLYNESTGQLFWRTRPEEHFPNPKSAKAWNKRWAGKEAFHEGKRGYRYGHLDNQYCAAHRVIWKYMLGTEPPALVDHKDRKKNNNRWINLRPATKPQNCANREFSPKNTSGASGVHKHKNKNKWVAQVGNLGGKRKRYVGIFDSKKAAAAARQQAMAEVYGEFAP